MTFVLFKSGVLADTSHDNDRCNHGIQWSMRDKLRLQYFCLANNKVYNRVGCGDTINQNGMGCGID